MCCTYCCPVFISARCSIIADRLKYHISSFQPSDKGYSQSPKRREDGEEIYYTSTKVKKVKKTEIVEIDAMEKEYLLIFSRLKLIQNKKGDAITVGR